MNFEKNKIYIIHIVYECKAQDVKKKFFVSPPLCMYVCVYGSLGKKLIAVPPGYNRVTLSTLCQGSAWDVRLFFSEFLCLRNT